MPRPPAPYPLAPGLPLPRRPAARRLLVTIALVVLLIAAVVPAVSANEVLYDETYHDPSFTEFTCSASNTAYTEASSALNILMISESLSTMDEFYTITQARANLISNYGSLPSSKAVPVIFSDMHTGKYVGRGEYGYFKYYVGTAEWLQIYITYDEIDFSNITTVQYSYSRAVKIAPDTGSSLIFPAGYGEDDYINIAAVTTTLKPHKLALTRAKGISPYSVHKDIKTYVTVTKNWQNRVIVSNETGHLYPYTRVTVLKNFDGVSNPSTHVIEDKFNSGYKYSGVDESVLIKSEYMPIYIGIHNPLTSKWFNATVGVSADDPTSPPDASVVNIYIQNSQTGALLANASLSILAAAGGTETEVVNATLPGGTGTYSLEKADYLKYHASATADGYTLLSPIIFGVPEGGTTIILWMSPDAPPDVPVEEGKSTLYGYAITQGSQQPISGATVSLDGYGSTTTSSTGFYLFNNVTPGTYDVSASAPLHAALSEPVTVDATATQHNLALKGHFLLTVSAKDADDLTNLHNTTISLSDGQESTSNPMTFNADYGPYTITAAAGGYYPQTQSAYLDKPGTTTATVLLTAKPEPIPPPEMPNYPPHNVKFTVQTLLGTPLSGVNITAQGIQQTPSTNILERLLGLNMTSTPINSELMSGTTDTNGEINFMMIEAVKYRIQLYKPDVVNQTLEIYPKEDTYPIIISTAGGPLLPDAGDALRDIRINVTTSTEGDTGHIHIDYNDTTRKTTSLTIQVTQQNTTDSSAPEDVIASHTVANDANVTHTFDLSVYKGQSFFVRLEAEHPDFGTVHRDYAVAFKGVRVPLGPLPDGLYIYVAGFSLMLLGGIFGATSATRGVVVIAFAGWLFYAFGWLDDLGFIAPVSLGLVSTIAVMGVIVTRYREEGYT